MSGKVRRRAREVMEVKTNSNAVELALPIVNEIASIGPVRPISNAPSQSSHIDGADQCLLFTYGSESDTMSAAFTCTTAATALTCMSLSFRGVPFSIIARIPFPYLPGPPRSALHVSLSSDVDSDPSPSSSELACSQLPFSQSPFPQQSSHS